jgi:hypothetical protein
VGRDGHDGVANATENHDSHGVNDASNPRLVLLFPGALGDLVLAADALAALRARHGDTPATLAVNGWLRQTAVASGIAAAVASLDDADAAGLFGGSRLPAWLGVRPRLHAWIGSRDPDVRAHLGALAATAAFHAVVREDGSEHACREYARQVGLDPDAVSPAPWRIPPPSERVAGLAREALLVVHAGAGAPRKRWARQGVAAIVARWRAAGGVAAELVGPAEVAAPPVAGARRLEGWTLPEVLSLLAGARAYVGNDSGISHLAGVAGVPGVVVFGATRAARWRPHRGRIVAVEAARPCADGIDEGAVPSSAVWEALAGLGCLDKLQARK